MNVLKKLDNIESVCFFPRDFNKCRKFFEEKFGFIPKRIQPTLENANFIEYYFKGTTVSMWARDAVAPIMGEENLLDEAHNFMTAIKLQCPEDVDAIHEEFLSKGVVCISNPTTYDFGSRAAYYTDCEKNIWEIFAWTNGGDGPCIRL